MIAAPFRNTVEEDGPGAFAFPRHMPVAQAERLLAEAYQALDAGKLLREALKRQRKAGLDPPGDVQYVGEPVVEEFEGSLGVGLATDIMVHEVFDGIDECTDIFEDVLGEALIERLEKAVARWLRDHPSPG